MEKLSSKHRFFLAMSFSAFFVFSIPFVIQGSLAPVTMEYYGINAAQQGLIVTMQSVGGICTAVFLALKGEKYNKIHTIAVGLIVICLASTVIGFSPVYIGLLVLVVVMGIGNSIIDIMSNGMVSDVYPVRRNTVLPIVHVFFGIGAMLTPVFVTLTVDSTMPETFVRPFRILAIVAALIFILYFLSGKKIMPDTPYINMEAMKKRATEDPAEIFKTGTAWFFLVVAILYFTFQLGTNMWLPTYAIRNAGVDFSTGGMMLTAFFAGALPMRILSPLFLKRVSARLIFSIFGFLSAAFMFAALFTENLTLMFVLVVASGFMQGASAPVFILMCCEAFPDRTASAASICTLAAGVAALTAPVWMGWLSTYTGFQVPMVMICICMFISAGMIFFKKFKVKLDRAEKQ